MLIEKALLLKMIVLLVVAETTRSRILVIGTGCDCFVVVYRTSE